MVYTLDVDFVEIVTSAMMNSIHTCEKGMRSVLFANGMGLEINSKLLASVSFYTVSDTAVAL